jgi:hypothetical protein
MDKTAGESPNDINNIRAEYFQTLALEHELSIKEIHQIYEETLAKLTKRESKGAMFMNVAFPAAINDYKQNRE